VPVVLPARRQRPEGPACRFSRQAVSFRAENHAANVPAAIDHRRSEIKQVRDGFGLQIVTPQLVTWVKSDWPHVSWLRRLAEYDVRARGTLSARHCRTPRSRVRRMRIIKGRRSGWRTLKVAQQG